MNAAFVDTWELCHPMMKAKLKALPNYQQINADKNVIQLGLQIRAIACGVETSNNKIYTTVQLSKMLHLYHQDKETSDHQYLKNFEGLVRAIEQQGGTLCQMPTLVDSRALRLAAQNGRVNNVPTDDDVDLAESQVNDEIKAAYFLSGAYSMKHGNMRNDLNNMFLTGNRDAYPKTVADAMRMMEGWRRNNPMSQQQPQKQGSGDDGLSFVQTKLDEQELDDEKPAASRPSSLKAEQKKTKKKKEKVRFNDKTKDAAGNRVVPHQSHATAGEEEEAAEEALEESHIVMESTPLLIALILHWNNWRRFMRNLEKRRKLERDTSNCVRRSMPCRGADWLSIFNREKWFPTVCQCVTISHFPAARRKTQE
jgi:hypothetical protein